MMTIFERRALPMALYSVIAFLLIGCAGGGHFAELDRVESDYQRRVSETDLWTLSARQLFPKSDSRRLALAAARGDIQEIEQLIHTGTPVDSEGFQGTTPLFWALRKQNLTGFHHLLRLGANPNTVLLNSESILHIAATAQDTQYLRLVLEFGADVDLAIGPSGETPIFSAIQADRYENVLLLAETGANLNHQLRDSGNLLRPPAGFTALHLAIIVARYDIALALLQYGADFRLATADGETAVDEVRRQKASIFFDQVAEKEFQEVIAFLRSEGVQV